jgi:hypothetical protein
VTGNRAAPGYWLSFVVVCSLIATLRLSPQWLRLRSEKLGTAETYPGRTR